MSITSVDQPPRKRICIFSDGTWQSAENETPTNIFHLAVCTKHHDGVIPQLVFYDPGVGVSSNLVRFFTGGAFGTGLETNILELYTTLAMNYCPGDEVLLFGYSRGAYTVRSLAGLIYKAGLVHRDHLDWAADAYKLYRSNADAESTKAVRFRATHGERIPIKALVCFDTVGALGVPDTMPWPLSMLGDDAMYRFHDTSLSPMIEHAIHVLSIDEDRAAFLPTRMQGVREGQVTEKFVAGYHEGVGGGSKAEEKLAFNALWFVVNELKRRKVGLALDELKMPRGEWYREPPRVLGLFRWVAEVLIKFASGVGYRRIVTVDAVHDSAVRRFCNVKEWRPMALKRIEREIWQRGKALQ